MVKLIHSVLNSRFDIGVTFMLNYFSVGDNIPVDSKTFLMINFIKILKSNQLNLLDVLTNIKYTYVHIFSV
jgi:hypothetical protein